jgi:hypothetical protein
MFSKKSKDIVYVIYYYPPDVTLTIDYDIIRFFSGSRDKWTIIDENGQEREIDAVLLFYGLPINKDNLEKLKELKKEGLLETYYELALIELYMGLTNHSKRAIKNLTKKLASKKGKPIKVKEMGELKIDTKDSLERAYTYHLRIRELTEVHGKVARGRGFSLKGKGFSFPSFDREKLRQFVVISIIAIVIILFGAIMYFIYKGFGVVNQFEQSFINSTIMAYNHTYNIVNPIK